VNTVRCSVIAVVVAVMVGGRGGGCALMDDFVAQQPGIHFHQEVGLTLGDRTRGSIPNVVSFIC